MVADSGDQGLGQAQVYCLSCLTRSAPQDRDNFMKTHCIARHFLMEQYYRTNILDFALKRKDFVFDQRRKKRPVRLLSVLNE